MDLPNIVVITGTDTGVGKTWTGCALARALRHAGRRVLAIKPLETGCRQLPQDSEDGVLLARAAVQTEPTAALMRLQDPVAPPEAAEREGRVIDFENIVRRIRQYAGAADVTLVEGAGGLLAPLTWQHTAVELARALDAAVLLVAADRLGTINHTLLTLKLLELSRLEVIGVVLTAPETPDSSTGSNAAAIARLSKFPRIHCVPRTCEPKAICRSMQQVTTWFTR